MTSFHRRVSCGILMAAGLLLAVGASAQGAPIMHKLEPPSGYGIAVSAVNDHGMVVGYYTRTSPPDVRSFVWTVDGGMVEIGTGVYARGINNAGQIVGDAGSQNNSVYWSSPSASPVAIAAAAGSGSIARSINEAGLVVGRSASKGYVWDSVTDAYHTVDGISEFYIVNNNGVAVGLAPSGQNKLGIYDSVSGVKYAAGTTTTGYVTVRVINDLGLVAGNEQPGAFIQTQWDDEETAFTVVPLPGYTAGQVTPMGINNAGQIVGDLGYGAKAFIWEAGVMTDLNDVLGDPSWDLRYALDTNATGWIVGGGLHNGSSAGYVMTPPPPPVHNVTQDLTYLTIQEAVDEADTGDLIHISPGVYTEQVWITKDNLTLKGTGSGGDRNSTTVIKAPAGQLPNSFATTGNTNYPVVGIIGCTGVTLENLYVDGAAMGAFNFRFMGIAFWNADGTITDCEVWGIRNDPFSGAQHGVGVWAHNVEGGPYEIAMTNVWVEDFQKNALALSGDGLTVDLTNVTTIGRGPTDITAQNGIQIGFGAGGTVTNCKIEGINYTGSGWVASGLLVYAGTTVDALEVVIDDCQMSAYWIDAGGSFKDGEIVNPVYDGLWARSTTAKGESELRRAEPQPLFEDGPIGGAKTPITMIVENSEFLGVGDPASYGVVGWTGDTMTFTVTDCKVKDWGYGIIVYDTGGAVFDALIENTEITGNSVVGLYSTAAQTVQASCNWWGDIGGPDAEGNPNPDGDLIYGDAIFWPWLDAVPGPGAVCDQYGGNNVSVDDDEVPCLTPDNPCVDLTVVLNRTDITTPVRGVSVTFELSVELELCNPGAPGLSISQGSYFDVAGDPNFLIIDNGGGSYTVDQVIWGGPCEALPVGGGELFTVSVAAAGTGVEAVGTVTVTAVLVRDCDNDMLPGIPGAPGMVTIDDVAPAKLTTLAAVQQRTGNDPGSTTNILLSWTDPGGDVASVQIWRKGFGFYPEYDDNPLAGAPSPPVDEDNDWDLVGTVAASAAAFTDYTDVRDFYYYAAYLIDACGNISEASALTSGTLNYHLGDVTGEFTDPGVGDNVVDTSDVSLLGFYYGITLTFGHAQNYLDVGPTTNGSVHGRPLTDDRINFEDLMIFAMNYGHVSKSELTPPQAAAFNELVLVPGAMGAVGSTFEVALRLSGDGQIQGLSVPLTWDGAVVEPVGVRAGELLASQGGLGMVLSPEPGTVDAALFGVRDQGISGEGVLAVVTFRVKSAGDPRLGLGTITARDAQNQEIDLHGAISSDVPGSLPQISALSSAVPNPFNPATELSFAVGKEGAVKLSVYSLRGHVVATLVQEHLSAGHYTVTWHGTDNAGQSVASGSYIVRLEAPDRTQTQRIMLVK